ncbi:MAG: ABC transporter substrate-binding protein [Candidatus Saccharicenans sp.]
MRPKYKRIFVLCLAVFFSTLSSGLLPARGQVTIKDSLGRQVKIPARVERIVCLQPELLRILVALEKKDRVVAVDRFPARYDHLMKIIFPEVVNLPVVSVSGEDANVERILGLRPDLVLVSPSELNLSRNLSRKLNCPVVSLSSNGHLERLLEEIQMLSRITASETRGQEIKNYMLSWIEFLRQKTGGRLKTERPRVYLSFWGSLLRTPVSYEPVELAGGYNLAGRFRTIHEGSDTAVLNIETLLALNPDIILVHGNYLPEERFLTPEAILSDERLQTIKAVRERKVYYTFGFWYWWDPALVLVEGLYLSDLFNPGAEIWSEPIKTGDDIFAFFYGQPGLFSQLCAKIKAYDWFKKERP